MPSRSGQRSVPAATPQPPVSKTSRQTKTGRSLVKTVKAVQRTRPANMRFVSDLSRAIEEYSLRHRRAPSKNYKPSSMTCERQMYYHRAGADVDEGRRGYESIGMSDTGTRRHEAIQEVLLEMQELGFPWKYWDVQDFLEAHRWPQGRCKNLKIIGKDGAETALKDEVLHVSFRCDGIIEDMNDASADPFYLFEFKNQTSLQASQKSKVDDKHKAQVDTYGAMFELNKALVTYENRDHCTLHVPEVYLITEEAKQAQIDKLLEVEGYVERGIVPPKPDTSNGLCTWCDYKGQCFKDR